MYTAMYARLRPAMIRKQVYIESRHERMLKRRARQRGVTEAEIIREALDSVETVAVVRRQDVDEAAGRQALRFMHALGKSFRKAPRGRTWTREALYGDRISRWTKS
jgi:hypothetical protein